MHPDEEEGHQCSHTGGTSAGPLHHPRLPHVHGLVQWRVTLHAVLGRHASHNGCAGPPPAGWTGVFEAPPVCSRRGPRWLGEAPHAHHCGLAVDPSHPDGVVGKYHRGGVGGELRPRGWVGLRESVGGGVQAWVELGVWMGLWMNVCGRGFGCVGAAAVVSVRLQGCWQGCRGV